jgi:hypothetical protein
MNIIYIMTTDFYDQIKPFFDSTTMGIYFFNFNYKGTDFLKQINNIKYPDTIRGEPLFQIMRTASYNNDKDNKDDIYVKFADFIIQLAIYHRYIDKPTNRLRLTDNLGKYDYSSTVSIINKTDVSDVKSSIDNTTTTKLIFKTLMDTNQKKYYKLIQDIAKDLFTKINDDTNINKDTMKYINEVILKLIRNKIVKNSVDINIVKEEMIYTIHEPDSSMDPKAKNIFGMYKTVEQSPLIFDKIFKNFRNLDKDIRKFYISFMTLMEKTKEGNWQNVLNFDNLTKSYDNYRINFKKSKSGKTLFSETLPFIPSVTNKLSFTNNSNKEQSINLSELSEIDKKTILHTIYNDVYNNGNKFTLNVNGKRTDFEVHTLGTPGTPGKPLPPPQFNQKLLISNIIENYMKYQNLPYESLDDLYVDMTTNIVFGKDKDGLYQMIDNKKVHYTDDKLKEDLNSNCYGTYINDNNDKCSLVFKCILNNNPTNLLRCLEPLREETLFDIAKSDISKINPKIMRNIIKTFGFKIRRETDGVFRPPTFDNWMNSSTIPKEVKQLVLSNKKLKIYLSEILNIIRKNPSMLDENIEEIKRDYSNIGIKQFINPFNLERPKLNENIYRDLLMKTNMPQQLDIPFFVNLDNIRLQHGGSHLELMNQQVEKNSQKIKRLFENLFSELVSSGKELKDEDKERIMGAIDKYSKLEIQLNTLYEEIQMYANVNKLLVDSNGVEETDIAEIHDFNQNKERINEAYKKIQNKINKNLATQNNILNALYLAQMPIIRLMDIS